MRQILTVALIAALALTLSGCVFGRRSVKTYQEVGPGGVVKQIVEVNEVEYSANWNPGDVDELAKLANLARGGGI